MKRESRLRLIWIRIIEYLNFFSGYRKIEMVPRTNREKQIIRRRIIDAIIIILFIFFLIICVVNLFNSLVEIPESEISYYEKLLTGIALFSALLAVLIPIFTTYFYCSPY